MADIRHRVGVGASPDAVYQALSTPDGLSGWWTRDVKGDPALGLKAGLKGGTAAPFPDDLAISSWG